MYSSGCRAYGFNLEDSAAWMHSSAYWIAVRVVGIDDFGSTAASILSTSFVVELFRGDGVYETSCVLDMLESIGVVALLELIDDSDETSE